MYFPESNTILVDGNWISYKDAVKLVSARDKCYELLETLIEASREQYVPDELKLAIKTLVNKMF